MRVRTLILVFQFFACGSIVLAQKEGAVWYFGQWAGLDFKSGTPVPISDGRINTREGVASICDRSGNLLFYTDGQTIFTKQHQVMKNGDRLFGNTTSTQSSIIVPNPGNSRTFYVFTVDEAGTTNSPGYGINYSIVDMNLNGELGEVRQKNIPLLTNTTERITAVQHKNGFYYWIIAHGWNSNLFHIFLLTNTGVTLEKSIPIGTVHQNWNAADRFNRGATGYLKSSPNGDLLVCAIEGLSIYELFAFNKENADLELIATLPAGTESQPDSPICAAYGVEFSPTGNRLYGSTRQDGYIYQWDLTQEGESAIIESMKIIRHNPAVLGGALQLGLDGKIYTALSGTSHLGVINFPAQEQCGYVENGQELYDPATGKTGMSYFGLPTFLPDFFREAEFTWKGTCLLDTTQLSVSTQFIEGKPEWRIYNYSQDSLIGLAWVDDEMIGRFVFPNPGTYVVELHVKQTNNPVITIHSEIIEIYELPKPGLPDETSFCSGSEVLLDAGDGERYQWENLQLPDTTRFLKVRIPGVYKVTIMDAHGCKNSDSTVVKENPPPKISSIDIKNSCGVNAGQIQVIMEGDQTDYRYRWVNFPDNQSNILDRLSSGDYRVIIQSVQTGCETSQILSVGEGKTPDISIKANLFDSICPGTEVQLIAEGGEFYQWILPEGLTDSAIFVHPNESTTYQVKGFLTDSSGSVCSAINGYTVVVFPYQKPELGDDISFCEGDTVRLDGGGIYNHWKWNTGDTTQLIAIDSTQNNLVVSVTDLHGCILSDTINVIEKQIPLINLGPDQTLCQNEPVTLDAGPGSTWQWNTGETSRTIGVSKSGFYKVKKELEGCSASDEIKINFYDPDSLEIRSIQTKDVSCQSGSDGALKINAVGQGDHLLYSIDDGVHYYQNGGFFEGLLAQYPYKIKVLEDSVCVASYENEVVLKQPDSILVGYELISPTCIQCDDGEIILSITGGTQPYRISWSTSDSSRILRHIGLGFYGVWITDMNRCQQYQNIELKMGYRSFLIPNAFSPNGDGINETWEIAALKGNPDCLVLVYNKFGKLIFQSERGYPVPWDGRGPDGNIVPIDSYMFLIYPDRITKPVSGTVTVLK